MVPQTNLVSTDSLDLAALRAILRSPPLGKCMHVCRDVEYIDNAGFNHCQPIQHLAFTLGHRIMVFEHAFPTPSLLWVRKALGDQLKIRQDICTWSHVALCLRERAGVI
jgi:hypothetical protein